MINVQTQVIPKILSALDAEGSQRYLFDQDLKPSINYSIDWMVSVFNKAFADNKLSEENLSELRYTRIFQLNGFSRVYLDPVALGHTVWSMIGMFPKPVVYPDTLPPSQINPTISVYRNDLSYIKSNFSAKRLTDEQWNENINNPFVAGNNVVFASPGLVSYAFLSPQNYSSSNYNVPMETSLRPELPNEFVGITYIKYPTQVNVATDNIEFPSTLLNLIVEKALNFISYKQGDRTNLYSVTAADVSTLVQLMR